MNALPRHIARISRVVVVMFNDRFQMEVVTAAEAGDHVAELEAERAHNGVDG